MSNISLSAKALLGVAALVTSLAAPCAQQQWTLEFKADYSLWGEDPQPLTDLSAVLTTKGSVVFAEGSGKKVVQITGTRNGVAITGLWDASQGEFFGGWQPAQGILIASQAINGQKIPFDGLAYVTADGVQHVLYGSTYNIGGTYYTNYFEMNQWGSQNPNSPWVTFAADSLKLKKLK